MQKHGIDATTLIDQGISLRDQVEQRPFEFAFGSDPDNHTPTRINVRRSAAEQTPFQSEDRTIHRTPHGDSASRRNRRKMIQRHDENVYAQLTYLPALPVLPSAPPAEDSTNQSISRLPGPGHHKPDHTSIGIDFVLRYASHPSPKPFPKEQEEKKEKTDN